MGRWKRDGNHSPPKNKLVEDSEGNEKIKYQVPDSNKTEHIERRNLVRTHREFHGDALDKVNQNVQEALKKFQDNKNKEYEKTQKQVNS
jgi:5-methylcytosine-specific restriction endonuclease McrA